MRAYMTRERRPSTETFYQRILLIGFLLAVGAAAIFIFFVIHDIEMLAALLHIPAAVVRALAIREATVIAMGVAALYAVFAFTVYSFRGAISRVEEERRSARFRAKIVDVIVHEITTPLTALRWQLDFLQEKMQAGQTNTPETLRMFNDAYAVLEHLNGLARKLIDILALEQEEQLPRKSEDISAEIHRIVESFRAAAEAKHLRLSVEVPENLPRAVVNKEFFSRAFTEIIENAVKFTDRGGILVVAQETPRGIVVSVTDSGIGIAHPERLFQPLQQMGREVREQRGIGAGLYLAKLAIEKQGGNIAFTANVDGGSRFSFQIPIAHESIVKA